jgi:hypothetical protein
MSVADGRRPRRPLVSWPRSRHQFSRRSTDAARVPRIGRGGAPQKFERLADLVVHHRRQRSALTELLGVLPTPVA